MVKKIRFFWRLLITFFVRRKEIVLASFLIGILSFFLLPAILSFLPKRQKTESIGLVGRYTLENIPESIQKLISLGLTQIKEDGTVSPGLAREWSINDNGKTYTFVLDENRSWHDGSEVKAKDINYNFKDVAIEILDAKTIKFSLSEPFSPFPVTVSRPVFKKGFIGAGQYKVKKITRNGEFVQTIFLQSLNKKKSNLHYRFYPTEAAAKTALKLGEVESLENMIDFSGFENWKNIEIKQQVKYDRYLAIFFDTTKPNLAEKNLRQALAYSLPKGENQERVLGPISPSSWAYNGDVKPYDYDLENAKNLLEKVVEKNQKISVRLATSPSLLFEAEKIRSAWEALGVEAEIEPMSSSIADFQALLAIQQIPSDPDQYSLWHSSQEVANITHLNNPRIDQLLEEGRKTQDIEKRKKIYFDFQRFLVEEVPAIFLYHPVTYEIRRK